MAKQTDWLYTYPTSESAWSESQARIQSLKECAKDIRSEVMVFTNDANDRLLLSTVGGQEVIALSREKAAVLGKIITEQSQRLNKS